MVNVEKCFGKYPKDDTCKGCEWLPGCQLYTATEDKMNRPLGGQDYDAVESFASDLADTRTPFDEVAELDPEESDVPEETAKKMFELLNFLSHLDEYDLQIVAEILAPTNFSKTRRLSVAEIARVRHVSRQAVHRKTLDMARKVPELRLLLAEVVLKLKKARYPQGASTYSNMIQEVLF